MTQLSYRKASVDAVLKIINEKILPILNIAKILSEKYEIVVTNPPYLSTNKMGIELKKYLKK